MSRFTNYLSSLVKKPEATAYAAPWQINTLWVLRLVALISGIRQTFWGEPAIGIIILICLVLITVPSIITRGSIKRIPIEIESLFLVMVLFQFIIGEARDFYTEVPYYDKLVHFLLPMMLGFITFVIIYTMYFTKRLVASVKVMFFVTFFIAMGIGALWEVMEYSSDMILYPRIEGWHKFQGSLTEDPYHDTMNDLVVDMLGALLGSTLAALYIAKGTEKTRSKRKGEVLKELATELFK